MFDSAVTLVVFREVLEIAIILGVVLAATQGLVGRAKWISLGFAAGLAGAACVAMFASSISSLADGMGQEFFNAIILFSAAIVIGWTAIWMRTHAREMVAHMKQVGKDVVDGKLPGITLAVVIGLAILREGAEIVLFLYSALLSGKEVPAIAMGGVLGLALGAVVGSMLYIGLVKLSTRHMLKVTGWLLILLVAGLSAQGAGFLTQAGYFENWSAPVWNTAWLLSQESAVGTLLHTLIGYMEEPTQVQAAFYVASLTFMIGCIMLTERKGSKQVKAAA